MLKKVLGLLARPVRDAVFEALDAVVPKDDKIIVFGSSSGRSFNGNPRAVFDHVVEHGEGWRPYVFLRGDIDGSSYEDSVRRRLVSGKSIKDRLIFLRARTLVGSHGQADFGVRTWSRRKIFVQTWHGRGTKSDGFAHPGFPAEKLRVIEKHNRLVTAFVTASEIDSGEKARSFNINERKLHPLGYPRNDALLKEMSGSSLLDKLGGAPPFDRVILYAPTYREGESARFFPFEDFELQRLSRFLEEHSVLLLLRRHINDQSPLTLKGDRIFELGHDLAPDINEILPQVDVLVTDYSSLFLDFLLFERPVVFVPYDLEKYQAGRGFMYGDYDRWTPGYKASSLAGMLEEFEKQIDGEDGFSSQRKVFNSLFNGGQGTDSSRRVFELVERLLRDGELSRFGIGRVDERMSSLGARARSWLGSL